MDIVERLREQIISPAFEDKTIQSSFLAERLILERKEAADEIQRLREVLQYMACDCKETCLANGCGYAAREALGEKE